jgi:hypothetical protein
VCTLFLPPPFVSQRSSHLLYHTDLLVLTYSYRLVFLAVNYSLLVSNYTPHSMDVILKAGRWNTTAGRVNKTSMFLYTFIPTHRPYEHHIQTPNACLGSEVSTVVANHCLPLGSIPMKELTWFISNLFRRLVNKIWGKIC